MKNPQSLLARVYGVYTIKQKSMQPVHFILMGNTMKTNSTSELNLKFVFDLKGSEVNRFVKNKTEFPLKASTTLKD